MIPDTETLIERNDAPCARFSLMDEMFVCRGSKADWDLLHDLHYKAEKLPIGPRFWKLELRGETIGVLVTGTPKGMLRERHIVFPNLKPGSGETRLTNTNRYNYINANFRVISRFVVDTMYRGIGAGYRMMNLVSRMEGNTFMEIQSSMSKFNVFGQKAGFRFVKPMNANKYEPVMKWFRLNFEASPQDFEAILAEFEAKPENERVRMLDAAREFYMRNSALENTSNGGAAADRRVAAMTMRDTIKGIQQIGLASPMYGIWKCPDTKGSVPDRLPLRAFDKQAPGARLVLDG
ncbi:MAG: hypothetical protein DI537_13840 [Stutzerimonas stutzeri]|nr:MAG: hypothetical protein DI537_13840 [Stutzerimonas stutzeri]